MKFIDKAIAVFSPQAALQRATARQALESFDSGQRRYEAARRGRRTDGWTTTGGSANAEIGPALHLVRARSRDLVRNTPFGTNIRRQMPAQIVGRGITSRAINIEARDADRVRANWQAFLDHADTATGTNFYALQHLVCGTVVESGEALLVWRDEPMDAPCPVSCTVLEGDYLDTGKNERLANGGKIIQGVEFDASGRRVAFWLFDDHPGEVALAGLRSWVSTRRSAAQIDHVFDVLRPGQVRGMPWLAPVILTARDLDDYLDADRLRKKIEACLAVFVKNDGPASNIGQQAKEDASAAARTLEKLAPGMIEYLGQNESIETLQPAASGGIEHHLRFQLQAIAAGVGAPYATVSGDVSRASYSSQREARLGFWPLLDHWQDHMMIPMVCAPAWRRVHQAHARLRTGPREVPAAIHTRPPRPWVDPEKDGRALERDLRTGRKSWKQMVAETGHDPDEQLSEIAAIRPDLDAAGIRFSDKAEPADAAGDGASETPDRT